MDERPYLFALMLATIGDRSLGLQARQLTRWPGTWATARGPLEVVAVGPRSSVIALCAAGLADGPRRADAGVAPGSLKELIEQNRSFEIGARAVLLRAAGGRSTSSSWLPWLLGPLPCATPANVRRRNSPG